MSQLLSAIEKKKSFIHSHRSVGIHTDEKWGNSANDGGTEHKEMKKKKRKKKNNIL